MPSDLPFYIMVSWILQWEQSHLFNWCSHWQSFCWDYSRHALNFANVSNAHPNNFAYFYLQHCELRQLVASSMWSSYFQGCRLAWKIKSKISPQSYILLPRRSHRYVHEATGNSNGFHGDLIFYFTKWGLGDISVPPAFLSTWPEHSHPSGSTCGWSQNVKWVNSWIWLNLGRETVRK